MLAVLVPTSSLFVALPLAAHCRPFLYEAPSSPELPPRRSSGPQALSPPRPLPPTPADRTPAATPHRPLPRTPDQLVRDTPGTSGRPFSPVADARSPAPTPQRRLPPPPPLASLEGGGAADFGEGDRASDARTSVTSAGSAASGFAALANTRRSSGHDAGMPRSSLSRGPSSLGPSAPSSPANAAHAPRAPPRLPLAPETATAPDNRRSAHLRRLLEEEDAEGAAPPFAAWRPAGLRSARDALAAASVRPAPSFLGTRLTPRPSGKHPGAAPARSRSAPLVSVHLRRRGRWTQSGAPSGPARECSQSS